MRRAGFPVQLGGTKEPCAAFFEESRIRVLSRVACRKSGAVGFSGRIRSLEWIGAPDCSPAPRTFFLAAPARRMDALWIGNSRLVHPISPYAGTGGLPARSTLFYIPG
jgi:hypothetical protein